MKALPPILLLAVAAIGAELTQKILPDNPQWVAGWRDDGTSDTKPRILPEVGAALGLDVWFPNSAEYVDHRLAPDADGKAWKALGAEYLAFAFKGELRGEMKIRFSKGDHRWKKNAPYWEAMFAVEPAVEWKRVVIPFSAFKRDGKPLTDLTQIDTLVVGYGNNELRNAGKIWFNDFTIGKFALAQEAKPLDLTGTWKFIQDNKRPDGTAVDKNNERDRQGYGEDFGWHTETFDASAWKEIEVGTCWEKQGYAGYDGVAWYQRKVVVPAEWKGRPLELRLGKPDDRGEIFWNGTLVAQVLKFGPEFEATVAPELVKYGGANTISVRIHDWYRDGGLTAGEYSLGVGLATVETWWLERGMSAYGALAMPATVPQMGGVRLAVVAKFLPTVSTSRNLRFDYRITDCFYREIAAGSVPVQNHEARVTLTNKQMETLYYGEWINVHGILMDGDTPVTPLWLDDLKLDYSARDNLALPALPEQFEDTPMGKLKLVDEIYATWSASVSNEEHPYKEGGVRAFWGGRRAYDPEFEGVRVLNGYREAVNNQHFGYRIGRGNMKPGTQYLLRVQYPEDKTRYFAMDIKAGRNYQGVGFRTGVSADNPVTPYPLSGKLEWSDHIVSLSDQTYGFNGKRTVSSENGFWVFFHDIGRVYAPQYDAGPAVAQMRLYEIPANDTLTIRYPEGRPRRVLMMDWERQPEADPAAVAQYAKLMGLNALSPVIQKWSFTGFYENTQAFDGEPEWYGFPVHRDGFGNENSWRVNKEWADATRDAGVLYIPRLEYGGSQKLPQEARVIGKDGKVDPCGRYVGWGANLLHPATWEDVKTQIDESVGVFAKTHPNIGGILWRMRSDRVKISYGKQDVEMFCKETNRAMPEGDAAKIAAWASQTMAKEYEDWWHAKRRDFHVKIRDHLRSHNPAWKLYYYNWDPDGWSLATGNNEGNTAKDWTDLYNVNTAREWYNRKIAEQKKLTPADYVRRFVEGAHPMVDEPHKRLRPGLYKDVDGIALFAPVHWHYLSDNEPYIRLFETGDGLAVCNQFYYEEKGRSNVQGDNYETSEMTPGGPDFAMAEEVLSFFHGDPNVITWTPYTIGRSFTTEHRRFARAFLSLPATRGRVVPNANADAKVRVYDGGYASVAHRGFKAAKLEVKIPGASAKITNLVTGESVPFKTEGDSAVFEINAAPMSLNAFQFDGW